MITLDEAQARLLALAPPLPVEEVPLAAAAGRWMATDAIARLSHPPADVSAMDGWALRFAELPGPFRAQGQSAAGRPFGAALPPGAAVRIFTGAHVPPGADCIAVQEEMVVEPDGRVRLCGDGPAAIGAHIRRRGQDVAAGDRIVRAGDLLTPARIGLLAAAGLGAVSVRRRPRLAILAAGDELVPVGRVPAAGEIVSANGLMLAALVEAAGATLLGPRDWIVADDAGALAAALDEAAEADVVVTVGGASVGDHDLVRPVLAALGAAIDFWRIAVRPGKPLLAGRLGPALVLGLPGNPVSALVTAHLFLLPLIRHLMGSRMPLPVLAPARAAVALPANGPRRDFLRARLEQGPDGLLATPWGIQDSAMLRLAADADCLIMRPEDAPAVPANAAISVLRL